MAERAPRRTLAGPSAAAVRLVLVADRDHRRGAPADSRVRRYRLARVAMRPPGPSSDRLAGVRRTYD